MKTKTLISRSFIALVILATVFSCKKSSDQKNSSGTITGTWETTIWGGVNGNVMVFVINSGGTTGNITQLGIQPSGFSVGDVLYTSIASTGSGTYSSTGSYHWGTNNSVVGHASAILTLQNNNTVLYVHYAQDAATGITPPDYYYQRQ
jgi:hypothetical protein